MRPPKTARPTINPVVRRLLRIPRLEFLDRVLIATLLALAGLTTVNIFVAQLRVFVPQADLALDTVAAIVAPVIAIMAWARFRERSDPVGLVTAAASLVLVASDEATLGQLLVDQDAPFYVAAAATLVIAVLLIVGIAAALAGRDIRFPVIVLLAPAGALLALMAIAPLLEPILPGLGRFSQGGGLTSGPPALSDLSGRTPLGAFINLALAALFLVVVGLARRLYRRHRRPGDAFLIVASMFAAFAEGNAAINSAISPGYLTAVDVLRLAFELMLLLGLVVDARLGLRTLRRASATVAGTRRDDVARGGQEERSRISRELHDGLAQDLWLAKLKVGRLLSQRDLGPEAIALSQELSVAIDAGLAEARQAVMALHLPGEGTFSELLRGYADDFSDTFGVPVDFSCDEDLPLLEPGVQAELVRIAQESLNNVRRHADPTLVHVTVRIEDAHLLLAIIDNGRGFDLTAARRSAFGLASMRERAQLIGGQLYIESRLQGGTRIVVDVPLPAATRPPADAES